MLIIKRIKYVRPAYFAGFVFLAIVLFTYEALSAHELNYDFSFIGFGGTFRYHDLKILFIPAYWFMMLLGLGINLFVSLKQRRRYGYSAAKSLVIPVLFLLVAFIGGKLMYVIENFNTVKETGLQLNGMSLFGAIFLFPIVTFAVCKLSKLNFAEMLDYCTPFGIILLACTRTGCFINGCCGAFTIWKDGNPIILPVQLMEVMLDLIILEICRYIENKKFKSGLVYPMFMILYGFCRFGLEFLRKTDPTLFIFSNGQIFAVISITFGFLLYKYFDKQYNKDKDKKVKKKKKKKQLTKS